MGGRVLYFGYVYPQYRGVMAETVWIVEDDREMRAYVVDLLRDAGYEVIAFGSADHALRTLHEGATPDTIITDLILPGRRGQELLQDVNQLRSGINVIVITAFGSIDSAIEMIRAGAFDYITKPFSADELLLAIERSLAESKHRREAMAHSRNIGVPRGFVAASAPMLNMFALLDRAARTRHPILITGESGTGKELVARAAHDASGRSEFVALNCAALPHALLESELFGHERGAFTGADRAKPGLFEIADRGTLFLDEIAELPLTLQAKLLRALEYGEVRRVGALRSARFDVRVIAATNRTLTAEIAHGRFREDLYWRLNVFQIELPTLRDRLSDIPLLAEHFLQNAARPDGPPARLSPDALSLLTGYAWPGNVRELRNVIERTVALSSPSPLLRPEDLPAHIQQAGHSAAAIAGAVRRRDTLRDLERAYILETLRSVGGNKSRAAEILGLDRKTLYRKLEEFGER
jgi:two-component system, NtrC family, response regulator AtoC